MWLKPGTILHKCMNCAFWEPALTCLGEPTGQGGCRFAPARNRRGAKLRECANYALPSGGRAVEGNPQEVWMTDLSRSKLRKGDHGDTD